LDPATLQQTVCCVVLAAQEKKQIEQGEVAKVADLLKRGPCVTVGGWVGAKFSF
jgi:hypothetical protein